MSVCIYSSESVAAGHPDKIADQIADAILDAYLANDYLSRSAIEVLVTCNYVVVAGEVFGSSDITRKIPDIVRGVIKDVGYYKEGFGWNSVDVKVLVHDQSREIAGGVCRGKSFGAGDQGIMVGYATNETKNYMPAPIYYAHKIMRYVVEDCKEQFLGPDGKTQLVCLYEDNIPKKIENIILSVQHRADWNIGAGKKFLYSKIKDILPDGWMCDYNKFIVNAAGSFVIGGPVSDSGLTGRKLMVDTYGGVVPHGGGAFSGKDATKVDRSAAYMARYLAKNIVAAGLASRCLVTLCYAIAGTNPVAVTVNTYNTGTIEDKKIVDGLIKIVDLSPSGIIKKLKLNRPIYRKTSSYGHFGRNVESDGCFSWEALDLVPELVILQNSLKQYNYL